MTVTNHSLTGAVIGALLSNPLLIVVGGILSHYLCDAIPHFGIGQGIFERNKTLMFKVVVVIDTLLLATLYVVFVSAGFSWLIILGALSAASPDIAWVYRFIKEIHTKKVVKSSALTSFHSNIQWSETPPGISVEVLYGLAMAFLCFIVIA